MEKKQNNIHALSAGQPSVSTRSLFIRVWDKSLQDGLGREITAMQNSIKLDDSRSMLKSNPAEHVQSCFLQTGPVDVGTQRHRPLFQSTRTLDRHLPVTTPIPAS